MSILVPVLLVAVGIAVLGYGADVLVRGAVTIARVARISAAVVGLTIVSMGTSLPELTVSVAASLRGASEVALGNGIGSNIFNILGILGVASLIAPIAVNPQMVRSDRVWMLGLSAILFPMMRSRFVVTRAEGRLPVAAYGTYLTLLVLGG